MYYFGLVICFFFKQKTAYEMRISDWSSDVCSSDLLDSKYLNFPGAACTPDQMAAPGQTVCVQDLSGTRTPLSSKWSGNAGIEYRQPVGNLELTGRVDANFRSNYNASLNNDLRSEEHTSELQSLMRISYAVLCLTKKKNLYTKTR